MTMTNNSNYKLSSSDQLDFTLEEPSNEIDNDNDIADFELNTTPTEGRNSRHCNKRNFLAKKKIEQLQEERQLKKLDDDYYDDWD
jgi:hypothetical protein